MKSIEVQLLESLGNGVRPFDTGTEPVLSLDSKFEQIMRGARTGQVQTDLGVRFAPSASGIFGESDQHEISSAVDRAAAAGVDHALILYNQRTLRIDVRNRIVLEVRPLSGKQVIDGIDGFVSLKGGAESNDSTDHEMPSSAIVTPARIVRNASLVHALAGRVPE